MTKRKTLLKKERERAIIVEELKRQMITIEIAFKLFKIKGDCKVCGREITSQASNRNKETVSIEQRVTSICEMMRLICQSSIV